MMILAGHPPTVFMAAVVTALYSCLRLVGCRQRLRFCLSLIPIAVAPLFLSAVQLWTGLQVGTEGFRAGAMSFEFATAFSFPPENLLTLLVSDAFGDGSAFKRSYWGRWFYWDASAYMGVIGLIFAIHGSLRGRGNLRVAALILVPLITIVACGRYTPFYTFVFDIVPGFDQFRAPSKFIFYAGLFTAALAGVGLDHLLCECRSEERKTRATALAAGLLGLLLSCVALWIWLVPANDPEAFSPVRLLASYNDQRTLMPAYLRRWDDVLLQGLLLAIALLLAATALVWLARRRRFAVWLLILLGVVELFGFARQNRGGTRISAEHLRRPNLAASYREAGNDRVLLLGRTANIAQQTPGYDLWGYDPVVLRRYAEFMAFTQGRRLEELDNIGGHHPDEFHRLHSMLRLRFTVERNGKVSEYPDPLPRFLLLRDYRVIEEPATIFSTMAASGFDARRTVILEEKPSPTPVSGGVGDEGDEVKLVDESTDELILEVELAKPAILVITDAYAEGWRARALPGSVQTSYTLMPANYVLRAIPLGAGQHRLRVEYSPLAYRAGAWSSIVAGLLFATAAVSLFRRRSTASYE